MISCLSSGVRSVFIWRPCKNFLNMMCAAWREDFRNNHQWISCEFLYPQGVMKSTGFLQGCWVLRLPPIVMMFVITIAGKGDNPWQPNKYGAIFQPVWGGPFLRGPETRWLLQESALARENCDGCAFLIFFCHSSSSSSSFLFNMLVTYSLVSSWYLRIVCMVIYIWLSWIRSSWESKGNPKMNPKAFIPTI